MAPWLKVAIGLVTAAWLAVGTGVQRSASGLQEPDFFVFGWFVALAMHGALVASPLAATRGGALRAVTLCWMLPGLFLATFLGAVEGFSSLLEYLSGRGRSPRRLALGAFYVFTAFVWIQAFRRLVHVGVGGTRGGPLELPRTGRSLATDEDPYGYGLPRDEA